MEGDTYRVGDEVEALFKGGTKWFKGRVSLSRVDSTIPLFYYSNLSHLSKILGFNETSSEN